MTNLSGQYLGRYYLSERLGEGGMAIVYKAYDTRLERDVAVKIIRTGAFPTDALGEVLRRFEREAKSLAKLSHPNIVKVYDYGEHEGAPYLVMEYLPGGTLKKMLGQPLPWQEAVRLILPVARGVAYAHQRHILHRDIKPANILVTESGEPMLSDFGIAKLFEGDQATALTGSGMAIGTPEYMAPEQWTGQTSPQSDLYSLAVVLYEMVTGRKPYMADTPAAILIKQATEPLPNPRKFESRLPEAFDLVLIKALTKDPGERYKDMNALIEALERLQVGPAVTAAPEPVTVEATTKNPVEEPAIPVTIQQPVQKDETIRSELVTGNGMPEEVVGAPDASAETHGMVVEKKVDQPENVAASVSKFLRSAWSTPRSRIVLVALAALLACVSILGFVTRSSVPPLFFSDGVQIYSLKGESVSQITQTVGGQVNMSPVGDARGNVYFTSNRTGESEIFGFNTKTGDLWQVTDTGGSAESWAPAIGANANLYFTSDRTGKAEIFGFNTETGELWQVTETSGDAASWSPTIGAGANLYFTSNRTGKAEIFGFNTKTGDLWQVTETSGEAESWSPTIGAGANLYFTSNRTGKAEIFGFNTRTGELWQETTTTGAGSWGPILLGRKIYYTSNRSGALRIYLLGDDEKPVTNFESWTKELNDRLPGN